MSQIALLREAARASSVGDYSSCFSNRLSDRLAIIESCHEHFRGNLWRQALGEFQVVEGIGIRNGTHRLQSQSIDQLPHDI